MKAVNDLRRSILWIIDVMHQKLKRLLPVHSCAPHDIRFKQCAFNIIKMFWHDWNWLNSIYVQITKKEQRQVLAICIQLDAPRQKIVLLYLVSVFISLYTVLDIFQKQKKSLKMSSNILS